MFGFAVIVLGCTGFVGVCFISCLTGDSQVRVKQIRTSDRHIYGTYLIIISYLTLLNAT